MLWQNLLYSICSFWYWVCLLLQCKCNATNVSVSEEAKVASPFHQCSQHSYTYCQVTGCVLFCRKLAPCRFRQTSTYTSRRMRGIFGEPERAQIIAWAILACYNLHLGPTKIGETYSIEERSECCRTVKSSLAGYITHREDQAACKLFQVKNKCKSKHIRSLPTYSPRCINIAPFGPLG